MTFIDIHKPSSFKSRLSFTWFSKVLHSACIISEVGREQTKLLTGRLVKQLFASCAPAVKPPACPAPSLPFSLLLLAVVEGCLASGFPGGDGTRVVSMSSMFRWSVFPFMIIVVNIVMILWFKF